MVSRNLQPFTTSLYNAPNTDSILTQLVELKNGETFNGHLVNCDNFMNITLREVYQTSAEGDRFWKLKECYIRGSTVRLSSLCPSFDDYTDCNGMQIKYLRVPDALLDSVKEDQHRARDASRRGGPGGARGTSHLSLTQLLLAFSFQISCCQVGEVHYEVRSFVPFILDNSTHVCFLISSRWSWGSTRRSFTWTRSRKRGLADRYRQRSFPSVSFGIRVQGSSASTTTRRVRVTISPRNACRGQSDCLYPLIILYVQDIFIDQLLRLYLVLAC